MTTWSEPAENIYPDRIRVAALWRRTTIHKYGSSQRRDCGLTLTHGRHHARMHCSVRERRLWCLSGAQTEFSIRVPSRLTPRRTDLPPELSAPVARAASPPSAKPLTAALAEESTTGRAGALFLRAAARQLNAHFSEWRSSASRHRASCNTCWRRSCCLRTVGSRIRAVPSRRGSSRSSRRQSCSVGLSLNSNTACTWSATCRPWSGPQPLVAEWSGPRLPWLSHPAKWCTIVWHWRHSLQSRLGPPRRSRICSWTSHSSRPRRWRIGWPAWPNSPHRWSASCPKSPARGLEQAPLSPQQTATTWVYASAVLCGSYDAGTQALPDVGLASGNNRGRSCPYNEAPQAQPGATELRPVPAPFTVSYSPGKKYCT